MSSDKQERPVRLVPQEEEDKISRNVLKWLNTFPELPERVGRIQYEVLEDDRPSMALSTIQGTYIVEQNITGAYQAEYPFKILYRVKPGSSLDRRLKADELLNRLADWARGQTPQIGDRLWAELVEPTARASLFAMYENGDEDHQIVMRLTYWVRPLPGQILLKG